MLCADIGDLGAKLGNHPQQVSKTTEKVPSAMGSLPPGRAGSAFAYSRSGEAGFDICRRLFLRGCRGKPPWRPLPSSCFVLQKWLQSSHRLPSVEFARRRVSDAPLISFTNLHIIACQSFCLVSAGSTFAPWTRTASCTNSRMACGDSELAVGRLSLMACRMA